MLKVSLFAGESEVGPTVIPLFNRATDRYFEKVASTALLPDVVRYIESLRPRDDAQYNLVNAMGAGEYFGSNINGDYFSEASLIHAPDDWTGNPLVDKIHSKDWPYGYPTFYYAHPYAHHRNKDASRAFGEVELAVWHDKMKRVELVTRVDKQKCVEFGGVQVWDKLKAGQHPDVSMGCRVPYDTCSICLDWGLYREAQSTFDPKKFKHPGEAVLWFHKNKHKIRGLSITRADYCEHAKKLMNRILPDGRKVFVYNDYPKFFDISFVFIGADKTAKVMMKIAGERRVYWHIGSSAEEAEKLGYVETPPHVAQEKTASIEEDALKIAFLGKDAKDKNSEIVKDVVPSQFASKAVPALASNEPDLPDEVIDLMARASLASSLSTSGGLGMVLRPREFQRLTLISLGKRDLAETLDRDNVLFPRTDDRAPMHLGPEFFIDALAKLLLPLLMDRSALAPAIEKRVVVIGNLPMKEKKASSSLSSNLLRKISAAYNSYRGQLMDLIANAQPLIGSSAYPSQVEFRKLAVARPEEVFSPLSVAYVKEAFLDEIPVSSGQVNIKQVRADVERGFPSRNT